MVRLSSSWRSYDRHEHEEDATDRKAEIGQEESQRSAKEDSRDA
jgi:hypothetical protein